MQQLDLRVAGKTAALLAGGILSVAQPALANKAKHQLGDANQRLWFYALQ
jgi:methanol dehydrogenase (cytochrome c) subunit 1